jgi:hypothetical protein
VNKKQSTIDSRNKDNDKKYQIRSMEELFIEEDNKKDVLHVDDIILSDEKEVYDDIIIDSFENLNLEDFKNHSYKNKIPGDLEHFNEYAINNHDYPMDMHRDLMEHDDGYRGYNNHYDDDQGGYPYEEEKLYSQHDDMNIFNEDINSFNDSLPVFI